MTSSPSATSRRRMLVTPLRMSPAKYRATSARRSGFDGSAPAASSACSPALRSASMSAIRASVGSIVVVGAAVVGALVVVDRSVVDGTVVVGLGGRDDRRGWVAGGGRIGVVVSRTTGGGEHCQCQGDDDQRSHRLTIIGRNMVLERGRRSAKAETIRRRRRRSLRVVSPGNRDGGHEECCRARRPRQADGRRKSISTSASHSIESRVIGSTTSWTCSQPAASNARSWSANSDGDPVSGSVEVSAS